MACINMLNPDQYHSVPPMSPRISFSNDFAVNDPPPPSVPRHDRLSDPNFEFSVGGRPMMAADELFFKGRMLPLRGGGGGGETNRFTTLRDELRGHDEYDRPPRSSPSFFKMLGLKKQSCNNNSVKKNSELTAEACADKELNGEGGARTREL